MRYGIFPSKMNVYKYSEKKLTAFSCCPWKGWPFVGFYGLPFQERLLAKPITVAVPQLPGQLKQFIMSNCFWVWNVHIHSRHRVHIGTSLKTEKKRKPPCPLLLMESHELRFYMCCHYSLREIEPVLRWLWERPPQCLCLLHLNLDPCAFPSVNFSFVSFCCVSVLATVNVHTISMRLMCQ